MGLSAGDTALLQGVPATPVRIITPSWGTRHDMNRQVAFDPVHNYMFKGLETDEKKFWSSTCGCDQSVSSYSNGGQEQLIWMQYHTKTNCVCINKTFRRSAPNLIKRIHNELPVYELKTVSVLIKWFQMSEVHKILSFETPHRRGICLSTWLYVYFLSVMEAIRISVLSHSIIYLYIQFTLLQTIWLNTDKIHSTTI